MSDAPRSGLPSFEKYRCERELGRGAFGVVYLAWEAGHERRVAIKVLDRSEPGSAHQFADEIKNVAGLDHPNIVKVHDSGVTDGRPYFVMPYRPDSVSGLLERKGRLPVEEALSIAVDVARALGHAHLRGVVHRDVKPSNLLLDADGHVYVADFGVARRVGPSRDAETVGQVVGTAHYASPEQCVGDAEVDGRSDLYSLACVLYELLSGRPPFVGKTMASVVYAHLHEPPPSIRGERADVTREVDAAIRRALAKDPAERYPNAEHFARALGAPAPIPAPVEKLLRWAGTWADLVQRKPLRWAVGLVAALSLATAIAWPRLIDTTSLPAVRAYRAGMDALAVWDLPRADSLFAAAVRSDSTYARARYRLAATRSWRGASPDSWSGHAQVAELAAHRLARRDRAYVAALASLGASDFPAACDQFGRLADEDSASFAAHYGLATCLRRNSLVIEDSTSPTGWTFAASYWQSIESYRAAFLALPDWAEGMTRGALEQLVTAIPVKGNEGRVGRTADGDFMIGHLVWVNAEGGSAEDSVAVLPAPPGVTPMTAAASEDAFQYLRSLQREVASAWVDRFPESAEAHRAWAYALEASGSAEALSAIRRAAELASSRDAAAIELTEIWLTVKHGVPDRPDRLADARERAIRLLDDPEIVSVSKADRVALALLTGEVGRAVDLIAQVEFENLYSADRIAATVDVMEDQLVVLATVGAVGSVLDSLDLAIEREILIQWQEAERADAKRQHLTLPAMLAFPDYVSPRFDDPDMRWDRLGLAQVAYRDGDEELAWSTIREIEASREGLPPFRTTLDIAVAEARLIAEMGDPQRALRWLEAALESVAVSPPGHLRDGVQYAAAVVPAMVTIADLHEAAGDPDAAAVWRSAAQALWGRGDELALRALRPGR